MQNKKYDLKGAKENLDFGLSSIYTEYRGDKYETDEHKDFTQKV